MDGLKKVKCSDNSHPTGVVYPRFKFKVACTGTSGQFYSKIINGYPIFFAQIIEHQVDHMHR